jgi:hypothetical protein
MLKSENHSECIRVNCQAINKKEYWGLVENRSPSLPFSSQILFYPLDRIKQKFGLSVEMERILI